MSIFGTIMSKISGKMPASPPLMLRLRLLHRPAGQQNQRRPSKPQLHHRRRRDHRWMLVRC